MGLADCGLTVGRIGDRRADRRPIHAPTNKLRIETFQCQEHVAGFLRRVEEVVLPLVRTATAASA